MTKEEFIPTVLERDGIAVCPGGRLHFKIDALTSMEVTREYLVECVQIRSKHEQEIRDLESAVNAREPAKFLPQALKELDARGELARELCGDGAVGKVMWGQAQAYSDSAALLRAYLPKSTAKGAFTE